MIFKIVYNNEIHRVRAEVSTFEALLNAIVARLPGLAKQNLCCDYKDLDGDHVRINCQDDFSACLEELEGKKSIKIFIKEDLSQTLQLSSPEVVVCESQDFNPLTQQPVEDMEAPVPKTSEPVLMTLIPKEERAKMMDDQEDEEICLEKTPKQELKAEKPELEDKTEEEVLEYWKKFLPPWGKGPYHHRGGKRGGYPWWKHKKAHKQAKFNRKFDEAIQKALPQIAVHVAQILRNGESSFPAKSMAPMANSEIHKDQDKVVHHGYICDGCGVSPIVGVCYKSSVVKDFDFCEKCEATIPHPHPFLKLRTPEQRPHVLITGINEEGAKPFKPERDLPELLKHGKDLFSKMCSGGAKDKETMKKAFENVSKFCNPKQFGAFNPMGFMNMMMGGCPMKKKTKAKSKKNSKCGGCPWMKKMGKMCGMNKTKKPAAFMTFEEQVAHAKAASLGEVSTPKTKASPKKKSCMPWKFDFKFPTEPMDYSLEACYARLPFHKQMELAKRLSKNAEAKTMEPSQPKPVSKAPKKKSCKPAKCSFKYPTEPMDYSLEACYARLPFHKQMELAKRLSANAEAAKTVKVEKVEEKNETPKEVPVKNSEMTLLDWWKAGSNKKTKKEVKKVSATPRYATKTAPKAKESPKKKSCMPWKFDFKFPTEPMDYSLEACYARLPFHKQMELAKRLSANAEAAKTVKVEKVEEKKEEPEVAEKDDVVIMSETDSNVTQELYTSDREAETAPTEITEKPKEDSIPVPEPAPVKEEVVVVEEVDPIVLANVSQLMAIFEWIPKERKPEVTGWVQKKAKRGVNGINQLLNLFLDEWQ